MKANLAKAKASRIPQAVGIAACDPRFLQLLNDAQERLASMGKWWGTYRRMRICVTAGCVTWPREVKTVEALNLCGVGIPVQNDWFEFQTEVAAPSATSTCESRQLLGRGTVSQYRDFTGLSKVRLYASVAADAGKRVLVQGYDANGDVIRTLDSVSGDYVDGEYLTLVAPAGFVESTNSFAAPYLTGVQKPITLGRVTATGVNDTSGVETQIAVWAPSEQFPEYRRTFLTNLPDVSQCAESSCTDQGNGCDAADTSCTNTVIEAIVRLDFVPAVVDADWLFIGNLEALRHMMRAITLEDRELYQQAEREIQLALRALRNELEAYSPAERTVVNIQPFGTARPSKIFAGFQ